jgi:hypothetical protein
MVIKLKDVCPNPLCRSEIKDVVSAIHRKGTMAVTASRHTETGHILPPK